MHQLVLREAGNLLAIEFHGAVFGRIEPRNDIDAGRLARTVGADQPENLASAHM